jgi:hypothetical protein
MQTQIIYAFDTAPAANRFLNALKFWSVADVDAKLYSGGRSIKVSYSFDGRGFDSTCSELDELAASYGGREISAR